MTVAATQLALFGYEEGARAVDGPPGDIAVVYTASLKGVGQLRYFMTVEDAMRFCDDTRSRGFAHGSPWAFFWTSLTNLRASMGERVIERKNFVDDGRYDWLLAELGCVVIAPDDPLVAGMVR